MKNKFYLQDHGSPSLSASTYVVIDVQDGDDLNPKFSQPTYRARVKEHYPITVSERKMQAHTSRNQPMTLRDAISSYVTYVRRSMLLGFFFLLTHTIKFCMEYQCAEFMHSSKTSSKRVLHFLNGLLMQ